jgi:hypothetical protein
MTHILLAFLLAAPASAKPTVDACRTGRVLDNRPLRVSIMPTDGSASIDLLLRYSGCRTTEYEPIFGSHTPPTAVRNYRAAGVAWEVDLYSEDGGEWTEIFLYYIVPGSTDDQPLNFFEERQTAAVARGPVDWGKSRLKNTTPPKFDFEARLVTR